MKNGIFYFGMCFFSLFSICCLVNLHADGEKKLHSSEIQFRQNEFIVKLKKVPGVSSAYITQNVMYQLGKSNNVTVRTFLTNKDLAKVEFTSGVKTISDVVDSFKDSGTVVEYIEPNYIYHTTDRPAELASVGRRLPVLPAPVPPMPMSILPNDPDFDLDWGLLNLGQMDSKEQIGIEGRDIGASKAWLATTGSERIIVGIVDTGVDIEHEDLKENIYINEKEIPDNGIDDDENGFIDDVYGWNFHGGNNDVSDKRNHGTHVAGILGAVGDNGIGIAGVSWRVRMMPLKFISSDGKGSTADAVEATNYAVKMGVHIINNSWGGGGRSQALADAIEDARKKNILYVAAAGNEGEDTDKTPFYPGSYSSDNVITVAATDNRDHIASWSNYSEKRVHLAAPGVNVYSTIRTKSGKYGVLSGTSMATPHVSGAAALLMALDSSLDYKALKNRLLSTVDYVRPLSHKTIMAGRLNIFNAVNSIIPERVFPDPSSWRAVLIRVESEHPYKNSSTDQYEITHPGAKFLRVHFRKIGMENNFDKIIILDKSTAELDSISGERNGFYSDYVEGDKLTVSFKTDKSVNGYGFAIDKYEYID